jgi:hypothetical protein
MRVFIGYDVAQALRQFDNSPQGMEPVSSRFPSSSHAPVLGQRMAWVQETVRTSWDSLMRSTENSIPKPGRLGSAKDPPCGAGVSSSK